MHDQTQRSRQNLRTVGKSEAWVIFAMLALVSVVLLPVVAQWVPSIYDDCPIETLPGLIQAARQMQRGGLPFWDFATFAGGKPTYTHNMYLGFYPPMYPLFLSVDTENADQCFRWLMLFPYAVHLLWAALGGYAFSRMVLKLHPLAAALVGILYSLSPEMGFQIVTAPVAITLSYIPWCLLAIARFMETGKVSWWLIGTVLLALMGSSGNPNYLIRAYFFLSAILALLWLATLWITPRSGQRPWYAGRFVCGVMMFAVSIALAGISWAGTLESVAWISHAIPLSPQEAARFPESNMHPLSVITLLIPGYFGNLDPEPRWGVGPLHNETMTLPGGLFYVTALVIPMSVWFRRVDSAENDIRLRRWTLILGLSFVFGLLIMMGQYTWIFGWACTLLPWFFEFPHPVYYRMVVCFGGAVLVGIGVSMLLSEPHTHGIHQWLTRSGWWLGTLGVGCLILAMFWEPDQGFTFNPFGSGLVRFGQWTWFVTHPLLYFAVALILLVWLLKKPAERRRGQIGHWIAAAIVGETLMIAAAMFYWGYWQREIADYAHPTTDSSPCRYVVDDHLYQLAAPLRKQMNRLPGRCVGDRSVFDNVVWYFDGRALMGYSSKPLLPWYETVLAELTFGDNNLRLRELPTQFLHNMNVRYVLSMTIPEHPLVKTIESGPFYIHELAEPMPYAYLQDQVCSLKFDDQLQQLIQTDLRRAVYVDPADLRSLQLPDRQLAVMESIGDENVERFRALQNSHAIQSVDQQQANRTVIQVSNREPAMLVLSECFHADWRVTVDGQPQPLHRVNYMQQGVWLDTPGAHRVEFQFVPRSVTWGKWSSLAGLALLGLILGIAIVRGIRGERRTADERHS